MSMVGAPPQPAVPHGPRAFRLRIRRQGPVVALIPAGVLGVAAYLLLHDNTAALRGVTGFAATVLAAPALLAAGIPLTTAPGRFAIGVAVSIALWLTVGLLAARRATRSPVATWRDFWREWVWLAAGLWLGVAAALIVIEVLLGLAVL